MNNTTTHLTKQMDLQEDQPPSIPAVYDIELRSDEVKDIIGTPPSWILRWGTILVIVLTLMLTMLSYFIKYPDTTEGEITIITSGLPIDLSTNMSGILSDFFVEEGERVKKNQPLAMLQNDVNYVEYMLLEPQIAIMESITKGNLVDDYSPKQNLVLGSLESSYTRLRRSYEKYAQSVIVDQSMVQIGKLKNQQRKVSVTVASWEKKLKIATDELNAAVKNNLGFAAIKEKQFQVEKIKSNIATYKKEIADIGRLINDEKGNKKEGNDKSWEDFQIKLVEMRNAIRDWQYKYLIMAPTDGTIRMYSPNWKDRLKQGVDKGEGLMAIIPAAKGGEADSKQEPNIELLVKAEGFGKIQTGQQVNIRLDHYPYREHGMIKGYVFEKSDVQRDDHYIVGVKLVDGFNSTFGNELIPAPKMKGTAEVLTEDRRVLGRIFEQFRNLF